MFSNDKAKLGPGHALRNLAHDNSSSLWRRSKSHGNMREQAASPAPMPSKSSTLKPATKLERPPSKMSLFNLFSKPKVEKSRGHTEVGLAVPMQPPSPQKPPSSPPKSSLRHNPPPQVQQAQRMRSSQLFQRSPTPARPTSTIEEHWNPPPLFQAYPQSIKYATLQACTFSPDVLLRTQSQRRQAELLREKTNSRRDLTEPLEGVPEHKKLEKGNRRLTSNVIYVLVTSGHVLQYAGDGPFDRLPEKVLKLGNESAAFACDLIPGKHWVLQISQSASEDGTVTTTPRHSIFSRLRLQSTTARRTATSFLLVMESAEEMESWMTAVRREIENLGGMKMSSEESRSSEGSSIDEAPEKKSADVPTSRHLAQRDPNRMSKSGPVDSPLQSQYDSPKIVTSEWEGDRSEKTLSLTDSVKAPSIATTVTSHDQVQLEQLRERSRFSYMSTATSASGTGTRNTSRNSSPAPNSPLKEAFAPLEGEPLRSATSLRSFHISMQPLPVTNEDSSLSAATPSTPQRHSIYGPTSPTTRESPKQGQPAPASTPAAASTAAHNGRYSFLLHTRQPPYPNLVRYSARSSSAPPSRIPTNLSPPPNQPAPTPPTSRPQSTIGSLPNTATLSNRSERRVSATPKPFLRPFPVRPQAQHNADGSIVVPRRFSSQTNSGPAPLPFGIIVNRSVTAPVQSPPNTATARRQSVQSTPPSQQLRRPNSVQIRTDHAPFLSSSRPSRAISNTPSFVPGTGRRASAAPVPAPNLTPVQSSPYASITPVLRGQGQQLTPPKSLVPSRSMPNIGLPPPAPPPTMPLPAPPPVTPARSVAV
ncbi:hypothetical protein CC80DRAFT_520481 [Byssothecium circinans]|uniref:PH domain-containing protein n=1 Tax=Byssothecium circinans TaxID=147558 RepID=A0A6A5TFH7_9PLEO|nr:hypothetical protein CC80DRAFT_520481 [Byssothecium circinans]